MANSIKDVASTSEITRYHKMGVAVPGFKNNSSFCSGASYTSVLRLVSDTDVTNKRLFVRYTQPYPRQVLRPGDKIIIGPSSVENYYGAKETKTIAAIHSSYIQLAEELDNLYAVDDPIGGYGSVIPAGWNYSAGVNNSPFSPSVQWYPYGGIVDQHSLIASAKIGDGFSNRYRFYINWASSEGSGASGNYPYFYRNYGDELIDNTYYRLGCYIKVADTSFNTVRMKVNDGSSDFITLTLSYSVANKWREIEGAQISASNVSGCLLYIYQNSTDDGWILIDNLYMEHAKYTSGASAGVYTFTELPDLGSEIWNKVSETEFKIKRTMSGSGYAQQEAGLGDAVEKFVYQMHFENVADTFHADLRRLIEWQKFGYNLIFHPNSYLAFHTKPVVYCNMTITNEKYSMFNHENISFDLIIEEV